jgi:hypothetical protein
MRPVESLVIFSPSRGRIVRLVPLIQGQDKLGLENVESVADRVVRALGSGRARTDLVKMCITWMTRYY